MFDDLTLKYKRQLELSAEVSGMAFWEFNMKTNAFLFNEYYYKFLKTTEEAEGGYNIGAEQYFETFIPQSSQQIVLDVIGGAFQKDNEYAFDFEYQMLRRDGTTIDVHVDGYMTYDDDKNPDMAYGTKHDITKRKKYEKSLKDAKDVAEKATEELKELNKNLEDRIAIGIEENLKKEKLLMEQSKMASMGEMLESIAHQWRQPLSVITVASSGMKMQQMFGTFESASVGSICDTITNSAEHLSQTIDDFRDFFKKDKTKTKFDLKNLFDKTMKLISSKFKNREIIIIEDIDKISINGFENELIQVFINILNNARDELEKVNYQRLIFINIYQEDNIVIIKFKDNAGGIPDDIVGKIFDSHFTTKEDSDGTGIGLFMSSKIIENSYNGSIKVSNKTYTYEGNEYTGAEFIISLPISKKL